MEKEFVKPSPEYIKILQDIYTPSKKLSDYTKKFKPEDEEFFENAKKEQLLKANSKDTEWMPMFERVEKLGATVTLLSYSSKKINQPTRKQIYFWAMQQAYIEYFTPESDTEITQQLEMDMIMAYLHFAAEEVNIGTEAMAWLRMAIGEIVSKNEEINAHEIITGKLLNKKHFKKKKKKITQIKAAEIINRIFYARGLLRINSQTKKPMEFNVRTIRRWESQNDPACPEWYNAGSRDLGEEEFTEHVQKAAMAEKTKRQLSHLLVYDENRDQLDELGGDPYSDIDKKERLGLVKKFASMQTEELATMYENYLRQAPERHRDDR